ncbi:MAG: ABC transporter ATP-binding protein [Defluviitaleaceae bacterium]|nr:ABC transporter ATP-binding protein [Defluviitaleaceae bacterium]
MLKIENVCYRYKNNEKDVLNHINAHFKEGKMSAIIGPSGSGKTTLLSIMAGLDVPTFGKVTIEGDDLAGLDLNKYRRERIAMIFQAFHLFPLLTAVENVCYPMEASGRSRKDATTRAKELLNIVGISDEKHKRYPANLSGGEQQRVAIARALSTGAKVILADEPTGNLDEENSQAVVSLLQSLAHDKGYAVVIVTHNLEIADVSDAVFRMKDGKMTRREADVETGIMADLSQELTQPV